MTAETQQLEEDVRRLELEKRKRQLQRELAAADIVRGAVQQTTAAGARVAQASVGSARKVLGYVMRVAALLAVWVAGCAVYALDHRGPGWPYDGALGYWVGLTSVYAAPAVLVLAVVLAPFFQGMRAEWRRPAEPQMFQPGFSWRGWLKAISLIVAAAVGALALIVFAPQPYGFWGGVALLVVLPPVLTARLRRR